MESTIQAINHIVKTPGNLGGKPHIAGRRIAVHDIVIAHLQLGAPISEVAANYDLSLGGSMRRWPIIMIIKMKLTQQSTRLTKRLNNMGPVRMRLPDKEQS